MTDKLAKQGHYWPHNKDTEFGDRAKKVAKETNSNKHCGGETDFQNLHITFFLNTQFKNNKKNTRSAKKQEKNGP